MADGRAIVIAAYAAALRTAATPEDRARAIESSVLLDCVILAAGAYHHTLAEGDRLLIEGYYPAAVRLRAQEVAELQAAWRFSARYLHLLSASGAAESSDPSAITLIDGQGATIATSTTPEAGRVWLRTSDVDDGRIVQLLDLRAQADDRWATGREPSPRVSSWRLRGTELAAPVAASPWTADGAARPLRAVASDGWQLPSFRRWLMIVDRTD